MGARRQEKAPEARNWNRRDLVAHSEQRWQFAGYTLDEREWALLRGDEIIPIAPQPFLVLVHLVRNRHRPVSKDELVHAAWHDTAISDSAIASTLHAVRRAIGDDGHVQRAIVTYRKRGYRFALAVAPVPSPNSPT